MMIRAMEDADADAVVALWNACGLTRPWNDPREDIAFARRGPNSAILVRVEGEAIVASVMVGHDGHRGWVYYVAADPSRRGAGHGRAIMAAAEEWLRRQGAWKLNLLVRKDNAPVISFYEHLGYKVSDTICLQKVLR